MIVTPVSLVGAIGLIAVILGTVLAAPAARGPGGNWWSMLASGAVLSLVGALVAIPSETAGGLIALIGGVAVLIAAALGY